MSTTSATIIPPLLRLRTEQQKAFPKSDKIPGTVAKSDLPKAAVPFQPHFRTASDSNENLFPPDPHSDWGINEDSI